MAHNDNEHWEIQIREKIKREGKKRLSCKELDNISLVFNFGRFIIVGMYAMCMLVCSQHTETNSNR